MAWNWQKSDWPDFVWDRARLEKAEQQFLLGAGVLVGTVKHLSEEDRQQLTVEVTSTEALTTSEIEGEILRPCQGSVIDSQTTWIERGQAPRGTCRAWRRRDDG